MNEPTGVITINDQLSTEEVKQFKKKWEQHFRDIAECFDKIAPVIYDRDPNDPQAKKIEDHPFLDFFSTPPPNK